MQISQGGGSRDRFTLILFARFRSRKSSPIKTQDLQSVHFVNDYYICLTRFSMWRLLIALCFVLYLSHGIFLRRNTCSVKPCCKVASPPAGPVHLKSRINLCTWMWTVPIPFHSLIAQPKQMLCRQGCWRDCHLCKTVEMPTGHAAHNPLRLRQCRPIFGPRNHKMVVSVQFNWRPFPGPFPPIPLTVLLPPGPDLVAVYIELYILSEVRRDLTSKSSQPTNQPTNKPTNQPTTNQPTKNQPTDNQPTYGAINLGQHWFV